MIEFKRDDQENAVQSDGSSIKVIGCGGAGANVLDRIALDGMEEAELVCMNSDLRALETSVANEKLQLGSGLVHGFGAGW